MRHWPILFHTVLSPVGNQCHPYASPEITAIYESFHHPDSLLHAHIQSSTLKISFVLLFCHCRSILSMIVSQPSFSVLEDIKQHRWRWTQKSVLIIVMVGLQSSSEKK